jgi:hypothetical protein
MNTSVQNRPPTTRRARRGYLTTVAAGLVKGLCGAVVALLALQAWSDVTELHQRQSLAGAWKGTDDFAVFFPYNVGNDLDEAQSGGNESTLAVARDLYPVLDAHGALFIDAGNYKPGAPPNRWLPAWPIRVNTNYLSQYPILDETGKAVQVSPDEPDWVVAVPEQYKSQQARIRTIFQETRVGGPDFNGAVQAQERMLAGSVPPRFRGQHVRIIWTKSHQDVFSFNAEVNPAGGNTIRDPIVEIMTPANSLPLDRFNAVTGNINTALKVRLDGTSAATLRGLKPNLTRLGLDDNLGHLVTGNENRLNELSLIRTAVRRTSAIAAGALGVMLLLSASIVTVFSDRRRRTITVRRLLGVGFLRTYRELFLLIGVVWLGQAVVAGVAAVMLGLPARDAPRAAGSSTAEFPHLLSVLVLSLVIETLFAIGVATVNERRKTAERLKEL